MKTIKFKSWTCHLLMEEYVKGGKCISLIDVRDGDDVAVATSWIPGLEKDELAIKDYSENEGMLKALLAAGIVHKPHRQLQGFPIVRLIS